MENNSNKKKGNKRRVQTSAELRNLFSLQNVISDKMKKDVLGRTCSGYRRDEKWK